MINFEKYHFESGECLYIVEPKNMYDLVNKKEIVVYIEKTCGETVTLPSQQALIIYKLAKNNGNPVRSEVLYEFYTDEIILDPKSAKGLLSSMISLINKNGSGQQTFIKGAKTDLWNGYCFCGKKDIADTSARIDCSSMHSISDDVNWAVNDLIGGYVGFYLDQGGNGSIKAIYLRIEKDEMNGLRAEAIHNLANLEPVKNRALSMRRIHESLDKKIHGASKLFHGVVKGCENLVYIELAHASVPQKINLIFDLRSYLVFKKHERVDRPYRGGLALQCVLCDIQSSEATYVSRVGLIREDKIKDISLPLHEEDIRKQLVIAPYRTEFGPLKLDENDDRNWYHWFTYR